MTAAHTRAYRAGEVIAEGFPVAAVAEWLAQPDIVVWVDFCAPQRDDIVELATELGLHELAVEDAVGPHQRPKLDHYATHQFVVVHDVALDDDGELEVCEIDAFVNARWLVTVRKNDRFDVDQLIQRWDRAKDLAKHGVGFLLYALLDEVVDGYFAVAERLDEFYDEVSEGIFSEHPIPPAQQRHWFERRQSLVRLHRLALPTREMLSALMRHEHGAVSADLYPYYQDVYDHVVVVSETTDSLRELVSSIVETNLSLRDYRQNQVMKKVTSWAAIIAVPTLITGWYGMNVPYPGSGETWGVVVAAGVAFGTSGLLYAVFRQREWL